MPEAFEKSYLVVKAYNDNQQEFLAHAPTMQRVSKRLLFEILLMDFDHFFYVSCASSIRAVRNRNSTSSIRASSRNVDAHRKKAL